jgi:hypothetical protein
LFSLTILLKLLILFSPPQAPSLKGFLRLNATFLMLGATFLMLGATFLMLGATFLK